MLCCMLHVACCKLQVLVQKFYDRLLNFLVYLCVLESLWLNYDHDHMKGYIEKIEKILGFRLEEKNIMQADFPDILLIELQEYLAGRVPQEEIQEGNELSCFLSLPDILDGSFNSHVSGGDLEKHWPEDQQIANALLFHEKVLIHDHLPHYVASSLDGYAVEYRYHGLRSWLKKLALWRPLILHDKIQVLPKKLSYSPEMKDIWDDGLDQRSMELLCYFDQYACDMIESGYEQECIMEINEVMYLLAGLSIEKKPGRRLVPFFAEKEKFALYQKALNAFIELSLDKYLSGHQPGQNVRKEDALNIPLLIDLTLNPGPDEIIDLCEQIQGGLFSEVRMELTGIVELLREHQDENEKSRADLTKLIMNRGDQWKDKMIKLSFSNGSAQQIRMQFATTYLQQISNQSGETEHISDRTIFDTLNTIRENSSEGDQLGHYSFAIC